MRKWKIVLISVVCAVALLAAGFGWYVGDYYRADEPAVAAMAAARPVGSAMVFMPEEPHTGLIFYPGGKVEYSAYAPLMRMLADRGVLCALVEMPFNLAVLDMNAADGIAEQLPQVDRWFIGGHSLGGSMAASYAAKNPDGFDGLVLLAAYSTEEIDDMRVISLYGSEDQVLNAEKYGQYWENLPEDTVEIVIDGGCHAYFGSYGPQDGDGIPTITAQEQLNITADALADFFAGEDQ